MSKQEIKEILDKYPVVGKIPNAKLYLDEKGKWTAKGILKLSDFEQLTDDAAKHLEALLKKKVVSMRNGPSTPCGRIIDAKFNPKSKSFEVKAELLGRMLFTSYPDKDFNLRKGRINELGD